MGDEITVRSLGVELEEEGERERFGKVVGNVNEGGFVKVEVEGTKEERDSDKRAMDVTAR